jgi:hypothetical protein
MLPAVAKHPTTDDVYVTGGYYCDKWTAATGHGRLVLPQSTPGSGLGRLPSLVDASRNRLVGLSDSPITVRRSDCNSSTWRRMPYPNCRSLAPSLMWRRIDSRPTNGDRYLLFRADTATVRLCDQSD